MLENDHLILITKYLSGEITSAEQEQLTWELSKNPAIAERLSQLQRYWKHNEKINPADIESSLQKALIQLELPYEKELKNEKASSTGRIYHLKYWEIAAACILIAVVFSGVFYFSKSNNKKQNDFVTIIPQSTKLQKNSTVKPLPVKLSDGSTVTLQPNSSLYYPVKFDGDTREVYLEGDASFDVSHNPEKPFLVYCNHIVTKVLGTSFDIRTDFNKGDVEVSVKSGRVQVFENAEMIKEATKEAVILTPNQRAIYTWQTHRIELTLVKEPIPLATVKPFRADSISKIKAPDEITEKSFLYDQTSLSVVFEDIRKVYGIEVEVENTNLNNCVFTGDVSNKNLFTLLKIICLSTNSDYEINGTKILIKGKGCSL